MDELRLSVSKTKCFEQCRKQFEFSYIKKLPRKEESYHTLGKFCHKVLEDFHSAYMNGSQLPYHQEMQKAFIAAKEEFKKNTTKEMVKECFDIINKYLKLISEERDNGKFFNVIAVEKQFNLEISEKLILNGMIDRIQIDDDGVIHVADYKTTKNAKFLKNDFFQLLTYGLVMLQEDPALTKIRMSYILLKHDFEYITAEFEASEILKIKDKYIKYAEDIRGESEYSAKPTILCGWCPFLDLCTEGQLKSNKNLISGEIPW